MAFALVWDRDMAPTERLLRGLASRTKSLLSNLSSLHCLNSACIVYKGLCSQVHFSDSLVCSIHLSLILNHQEQHVHQGHFIYMVAQACIPRTGSWGRRVRNSRPATATLRNLILIKQNIFARSFCGSLISNYSSFPFPFPLFSSLCP